MRTRTRGSYIYSTHSTTGSQRDNVSHSCVTSATERAINYAYPTGHVESMTDAVVPGYRARSARGEVFNNPMSSIKETRALTQTTSSVSFAYKSTDSVLHRHCPDYYWESIPDSPVALNAWQTFVSHLGDELPVMNLRDMAGTEAYAAIDNPILDGAVFIAELRETMSLLRNPLSAVNGRLREVRRIKNRSRKSVRQISVGQYLEENWLSYRFGVAPLVRDVEDAAAAVAETVLNHRPERKTARGSASDSANFEASGTCPYDSRCDYTWVTNSSIQVRAGVLYEYHRSPDTFGIDFARVPVAAWEAIPYSFLVDRFLNVGSFIEAITPKAGIRHLAAWTSVERNQSTTRTGWLARVPAASGRVATIHSDGQATETFVSVSKTRTPGVKLGLSYNPHPFSLRNGDLDKAEILDLVALGSQILRSP